LASLRVEFGTFKEQRSVNDSTCMLRFARSALTFLMLLGGAATAYATDSYDASTGMLAIPKATIGGVTYADMLVTVGTIVSTPSGNAPNGSEDTYNPANGQLTVPAVMVGGSVVYNAVVTVASLVSIGSVSGADSFDGTHLTIASVGDGNTIYTQVVLAVGLSNVLAVDQGMPTAGQDQFYPILGSLFIPAVQVGGKVYTNVTLTVAAQDLVSVGGATTTPITTASGDLQNSYMAGTYSVNEADDADLDEWEDFLVGGCAVAGTPCIYSAATMTLSGNASPTGGTISNGTDSGTFVSQKRNPGGLKAFEMPTLMSLVSSNGSAWQGAISLNNQGSEMVAMEAGANAAPGMRVGLVPAVGMSNASLTSSYVFVGIATNPSGAAGDEGLLDTLKFDGKGGFTGSETYNTYDYRDRTGGIHKSMPLPSGTYSVAGNGTMSLTFLTGVNANSTFTGALNGEAIVLTNLSDSQGPRALYVGVIQPTSADESQACGNDPLLGPASASALFESVSITYHLFWLQQLTFSSGGADSATMTQDGGIFTGGGGVTAYPSGDIANVAVLGDCSLIIPHQVDSLGHAIDYQLGAVSPDGAVFVLSAFDYYSLGPQVTVGVRISNVIQND
jgi:hypothetical protein